jgi:isopenicillin N synthase-like dioxygenase
MNFILTACQRWKFYPKTYSFTLNTSEPENAIRATRHGDINLITLWVLKAKGLQVKTNGEWIEALLLSQTSWLLM